jgi:hypothetical protein
MFVNKPSTVLVNTGIAANNTVSGENIALEPFGILKNVQRASVGCRLGTTAEVCGWTVYIFGPCIT